MLGEAGTGKNNFALVEEMSGEFKKVLHCDRTIKEVIKAEARRVGLQISKSRLAEL